MNLRIASGVQRLAGRFRALSLRTQIALLAAGSVAVAVIVASAGAYFLTRNQLLAQIDQSLVRRAPFAGSPFDFGPAHRGPPGELDVLGQVIATDGTVLSDGGVRLPVTPEDVAVAQGRHGAYFRSERLLGVHLRILTAPARLPANGAFFFADLDGRAVGAVQVARPLTEVDRELRSLRLLLVFVALGGVGLAAGLGVLVARSALRPVAALTHAAEHVARTQDLSSPIDVGGQDELGRLGTSFNAMLAALATSRAQQQRLVHDASHELRTPLTSLRTNVEMLAHIDEMDATERTKLLGDLKAEMEELSALVSELVDLATGPGGDVEEAQDVRLDELVAGVVERTRRRTGADIVLEAEPTVVTAPPVGLERAVANVLHNATKWNSPGRPIEVRVRGGRFVVRDHGPGIDPEDAPFVFDRFYRAPAARSMPGSGLGLAITKEVVERSGGTVFVEGAPGGGAVVGFELPSALPVEDVTPEEEGPGRAEPERSLPQAEA